MAEEAADTKLCHNCKKQISANNFMMHEMHCRRHIALCEQCGEPVPRDEMESHFEETHAQTPCPKCQVKVERSHLEEHQENDCAKKPMKCFYCHLDFPKVEFESHTDYCGSRTEACPKCGQYIKLKDQVKHEDSNCHFPESKPVNTNAQQSGLSGLVSTNEYLAGLPAISPFQLEEMHRVMGVPGSMNNFQSRSQQSMNNKPDMGLAGQSHPRRNVARVTKRVNVKPDVNKTSGSGGLTDVGSAAEIDRLLALQIAEEDDTSMAGMHALRDGLEITSPQYPSPYDSPFTNDTFPEDAVMIPCEFCGELCAADNLVQHQSGCSLDRISAMLPHLNNSSSSNNISRKNNNSLDAVGQSRMRSPIQGSLDIMHNYPVYEADAWLDDTLVQTADPDLESTCLPCEFCSELFPLDTLVQHQAICDSNTTMTPRNLSAKTTGRTKAKPTNAIASALADDFPNLSSRRHQPPPTLAVNDSDDEDVGPRRNANKASSTHTVRKPSTSNSSTQRQFSNGANGALSTTPQGASRAPLNKYGVQTPDRGDHYTRPTVYSRPLGAMDDRDTDSWLQPGSHKQMGNPRGGSDQRTRKTLEHLLADSSQRSQHDLLSNVGQQRSLVREGVTGSRSTVPEKTVNAKVSSTRSKPTVGPVSRSTGSRTVTNPSQPPRSTTTTGTTGLTNPARNRSVKPGFDVRTRPSEADQLSDMVTSQRATNRTRVFDRGSTRNRSDKQ